MSYLGRSVSCLHPPTGQSHCLRAILLTAMLLVFGQELAAQGHVTEPLPQALKKLEGRFGVTFSYDAGQAASILVPHPADGLSLENNLDSLLADTEWGYTIIDSKDIVLRVLPPEPLHLCGYVVDQSTGEPLPYANIALEGSEKGCYTNEDGYFDWKPTIGKTAQLRASYLGYEEKRLRAFDHKGKPCFTIRLKPTGTELASILVKEFTLEMMERAEDGHYHFAPQDIPTLPGWGEPDLLRSLQLLPGISAADESASNLNIRGGASDQNLLLWDDIPIYHSGHFFGLYSAVNPYAAQSMDVYRGSFGAEYGGRVSGVIDIKGKPVYGTKARYGAGMNLLDLHGYADIPLKPQRSSLLLALRRSYTDWIPSRTYQKLFNQVFAKGRVYENQATEAQSGGAATSLPSFFYSDLNAKWAFKPSEKSEVAVSLYAGSDQFDYQFKLGESLFTYDKLLIENKGISARYTQQWNKLFKTDLKAVMSNFSNNYIFSYAFGPDEPFESRFMAQSRLNDVSFSFAQEWDIFEGQRLKTGAVIDWLGTDYLFQSENPQEVYERNQKALLGRTGILYGEYELRLPPRFFLTMGLRYEHFTALQGEKSLFDQVAVLPRFSASWHPFGDSFFLHANGGFFRQYVYQIPAVYSDLGAGEKIWVMADDLFPVLNAGQLSAGYGYQRGRFLWEMDFYVKGIQNLSSLRLTQEEGVETPFTQMGSLGAAGFDAMLRQRWNKYTLWISYSLSAATNQFPEINDGAAFFTDTDQRHTLTLTQTLALKSWDLSATWYLNSGRPYTLPTGIGARPGTGTGEEVFFLQYAHPNNARLPAYHRLDLAANYRFQTEHWLGKLGLSIINAYNRTNLFDIDFLLAPSPTDPTEMESVGLRRPMLGFTPNLFIQIEW
ncbi:MAG: TonB-dependent receptor [Phaeodactylibacter sp.]|nr:TonB-dependent receptor [Phaeodactylibacter sp.]